MRSEQPVIDADVVDDDFVGNTAARGDAAGRHLARRHSHGDEGIGLAGERGLGRGRDILAATGQRSGDEEERERKAKVTMHGQLAEAAAVPGDDRWHRPAPGCAILHA
jgi:hypothetical protein